MNDPNAEYSFLADAEQLFSLVAHNVRFCRMPLAAGPWLDADE